MPNPATDKLLKILRLEAQTGYADKAVTRGLASFSAAWIADAARAKIEPAWAEEIAQAMRDYSASTEQDKRKALLDSVTLKLRMPVVEGAPPEPAPVRRAEPAPRAEPPRERAPKPPQPERSRNEASRSQPAEDRASSEAPWRTSQTPEREPVQRPARAPDPAIGLNAPITKITGIGEVNAQRLNKLGVRTIDELLHFYPARYDDYSALKTINQLEVGEQVTIIGQVASVRKQRMRTGQVIFKAAIRDMSGVIECSWFTTDRFVDSLAKQFVEGREMVISGKVGEYMGKLVFQSPTHEPAEKEWVTGGNIVPVYRLTEGLQPLLLRRVMKRVAEYWPARVPEFLPDTVRRPLNLMTLSDALRDIHFPRDMRAQENARRRLAFDELFVMQLAIQQQRLRWRGEPALPLRVGEPTRDRLIAALPFKPTGAQVRAIGKVHEDMRQNVAMHRLLQGDVGAGKTAVAAIAMAMAATAGAQSALMAPTEILAEQHFKSLSKLFTEMGNIVGTPDGSYAAPRPINLALLTGGTKAAEKRAIYEGLADGSITVVIGTHALIQEAVNFKNLGFVVIDEQHRFGVEQRSALRQKGRDLNPHTLVMTATPIPRTLALTLYGDLDNTILDEMPPGRQPITTHWFTPAERERAYSFVRSQVNQGRQAFVICPLVEESDKIEAKAAVEEHARLQRDVFPNMTLGLLHGRMKPAEKDEVMAAFARGEIHVLVSTSVVEVGIDVPNATVMMIEGANRFGLSQLHQFRGRVGRGAHASYCLLIADSTSAVGDERLQAIVSTQDGFKLAEKDLEIRGPGEFFGTRQSGDPELRLVNFRDRDLLDRARDQAEKMVAADPALAAEENQLLSAKVNAFWAVRDAAGDAS